MPQQTINTVIIAIAAIIVVILLSRTIAHVWKRRTIRDINRGLTTKLDPHKEVSAEITECSGPQYTYRKVTPVKAIQARARSRSGYRAVPGMNPRDAVGRGE